jgi:pimeloyl-ACP methyl ester carboxylesterase
MFGALGGLGVPARGLSSAAFALSLLAGCAGQSLDHVLARDLASKGGLSCSGHLGWNDTQVQHVVLWLNGSGIYSSAFVHPSIEDALEVNPVAYMTLDKPGIRAPFQDPAALTVDDGVLEQYTQGHVLECARQALTWSDEQFGTNVRFHFRGHSEGTLISLLLYEKLLSEEPALAARVSSLVLSGLALEPFDKLVERQTNELPPPQRAAFFSAIERCDWPKMRNRMAVSCAYLADAYARRVARCSSRSRVARLLLTSSSFTATTICSRPPATCASSRPGTRRHASSTSRFASSRADTWGRRLQSRASCQSSWCASPGPLRLPPSSR